MLAAVWKMVMGVLFGTEEGQGEEKAERTEEREEMSTLTN
jgi:hypothetical protein